jgi:hypothetical protein
MPRLGLFDQFKTIAAKHNGGNIEVSSNCPLPLVPARIFTRDQSILFQSTLLRD